MLGKKIIAGVLLASATLWGAGVSGSPHDLSGILWAGTNTEDNGETCVYCHTPHAANPNFAGAPLWNKNSTASTADNAFVLYGATVAGAQGTTIAGTAVGNTGGVVNAPSMACLSCHDGVSAVNSVVNAPGAGYSAGGDGLIGSTAATISDALLVSNVLADLGNAGVDLSNDHPISVPYPVGGTAATNPASLILSTTALAGTWAGASTIDDLLRTTAGVAYVECGSCHDPHDGATSYILNESVYFLRTSNNNSALCVGCHEK